MKPIDHRDFNFMDRCIILYEDESIDIMNLLLNSRSILDNIFSTEIEPYSSIDLIHIRFMYFSFTMLYIIFYYHI